MTFHALDLTTKHLKNIKNFQDHGQEKGLCAVCMSIMDIRAAHTPGTSAHFWHGRKSDCPTVTKNRIRYEQLGASEYDDDLAVALRNATSENMYEIYITFQALADGGRFQEFKNAIKKADEINIWRYKGLTLPYIPYILVSLTDMFMKKESVFRENDFFFILSPAIRTMDQLWNKTINIKESVIKVSKDFEVLAEFLIPPSLTPLLHPAWFDRSTTSLRTLL